MSRIARLSVPSFAVAATLLASAATAQTAAPPAAPVPPPAVSPNDPGGITNAAMLVQRLREADEFAVEAGRLAMTKASTGAVKEYAQMMIVDHTRSAEALTAIVDAPAWKIPEKPAKPSDRNADLAATLERLGSAADVDFDRIYVSSQRQLHEDLVVWLRDYAKRGDVEALVAHARAILPDMERHLEMIKRVPLPA